jgi:UDPglucose 6-dehydrogenase
VRTHRARIRYESDAKALGSCAVVYVACDVPTDDRGDSDLASVRRLLGSVCASLARDAVLVVLCQVPPGFTRALDWPAAQRYYQVETLVFGRAVERAMHPERFIVGCADPGAPLPGAYRVFLEAFGCPVLPMRYESAELAKIAINCCLVASVTVANTLAELSERIGADWNEIIPALRLDRRIGEHAYLAPGLGIAGGNLERDLATVLRLAGETGAEAGLIHSFVDNSRHRRDWALRTLHREVLAAQPEALIAVLGLAYKENTDSIKNSPSIELIRHLKPWRLRIHDPVVAARVVDHPRAVACASPLEAAAQADVLAVMTPWPQYRDLVASELACAMRGRVIVDPYRVFNAAAMVAAGFDYFALGAPPSRGARKDRHA